MEINKKKEEQYLFWEESFSGHDSYMMEGEEYDKIRKIIKSYIDFNDVPYILDVGCASGGTYSFFRKSPCHFLYMGVDYCEKFIKSNKKRFPEVDWEVQDARCLKEQADFWDYTIYYDSLDSLDGWEKALDEAMRVTIKKIIITFWKDKNPKEKVAYLKKHGWDVEHFIKTKEQLGLSEHHFVIATREDK